MEVALNISARLKKAGSEDRFRLTVIHREPEPASELGPKASSMLARHLSRQGIGFIHGRTPSKLSRNRLEFESGETLDCDLCILCTSASADLWLKRSELPVDDKGFLLVETDLQVPGHPGIFGAGDCIRMKGRSLVVSCHGPDYAFRICRKYHRVSGDNRFSGRTVPVYCPVLCDFEHQWSHAGHKMAVFS